MRRQGLLNGRCTNEPGLGWSWTLLGVIGGFGSAVVYLVYPRPARRYLLLQRPADQSQRQHRFSAALSYAVAVSL
ncbi:hypothetical protein J3E69DRAFT_333624 [Trichoderma sp. SZMC 28015]